MFEKYEKLIKKIAWDFHRTTDIEWEELFGEAQLAFVKALASYNPKRAKFTTWVFICTHNHLLDFIQKQKRSLPSAGGEINPTEAKNQPTPEDLLLFKEKLLSLNVDVKTIFKILLKLPNHEPTRQQIKKILHTDYKWPWKRIWCAFDKIKNF